MDVVWCAGVAADCFVVVAVGPVFAPAASGRDRAIGGKMARAEPEPASALGAPGSIRHAEPCGA